MLQRLARSWAPTAMRAVASGPSSVRQMQPSTSVLRSFSSSSSRFNSDEDKSATTQQLEAQTSGQPTSDPTSAGSSNVSDAIQRELPAQAEAESAASTATSAGRPAAPTNLDDILGSLDAASALPGSDAAAADEASTSSSFRDRASPIVRGSAASRYSPTLFQSSSALPHRLFVNSSRNNTILTLTSPSGDPLASASGGSVGFKKSARSGYEAGYRAAFSMFGKINEFKDAWRIQHLEVLWNGFGQGREAVYRAMLAGEGQATKNLISKMTDKTPVKIGGVRPKKRRML